MMSATSVYLAQRRHQRRVWNVGWALFALAILATALACHPIREGVMRVTPGVPDRTDSDAAVGSSRCEGAVPTVLSASGRWWPATPAGAPCPGGCLYDPGPDGGAYCGAADGGAR